MLVRQARPVNLDGVAQLDVVDVRLLGGVVSTVGPSLRRRRGEQVLEAAGRWLMPGLWDAHVHLGQWARSRIRLDVSGAQSPDAVTATVAARLRSQPEPVLVGHGYRSALWDRHPTLAELDRVSGDAAVILISGDAHNGWINSRAAAMLGITPPTGLLLENPWFDVLARLDKALPPIDPDPAYRSVLRDAASMGVVGITDFEFEPGHSAWVERASDGLDLLRVRTATYPDNLEDVIKAGLHTGAPLAGDKVRMGPLKVIFDGSLNTATAYCHEPYRTASGGHTCGVLNLTPSELTALLRRATDAQLRVAVHAIGDAAVSTALDAVAAAGATGSIEHAQLIAAGDVSRFAPLRLTASVQPAHLLDDREVTHRIWSDRADRSFPFRSLLSAGARLALGSDAPVAPLDPWLAISAAVHRGAEDDPPWNPAESLTVAQALRASTDGRIAVLPGGPADLVLLDADPLIPGESVAEVARRVRRMRVAATIVAGAVVHLAI